MNQSFQSSRVKKLKECSNKTLEKCATNWTWNEFKRCFPEHIRQRHRHLLKQIHQQLTENFRSNMKHEFELICNEWDLFNKLNDLDINILYQKYAPQNNNKADQSPAYYLRDVSIQYRKQQINQLGKILERLRTQNQSLHKKLSERENRMNQTKEQMQNSSSTFDQLFENKIRKWKDQQKVTHMDVDRV